MLKLKESLIHILNSAPNPKSVEAEAQLILFHFFREKVKTPAECVVTLDIELAATAIAKQRAEGVPLQHLLGYQFFYEREYEVSSATLIPRPETEILVDAAIRWAKARSDKNNKFAELGLGSGVISIELLLALPGLTGIATEVSSAAVQVATRNLETWLGVDWQKRLRLLEPSSASLGFEPFLANAPYDLVISNPPYLKPEDEIEDEVRLHEPSLALFPEKLNPNLDENFYYQNFAHHAHLLLSKTGAAFFEVPHERAQEIKKIWNRAGLHAELIQDLTGRPRVLKGTFLDHGSLTNSGGQAPSWNR